VELGVSITSVVSIVEKVSVVVSAITGFVSETGLGVEVTVIDSPVTEPCPILDDTVFEANSDVGSLTVVELVFPVTMTVELVVVGTAFKFEVEPILVLVVVEVELIEEKVITVVVVLVALGTVLVVEVILVVELDEEVVVLLVVVVEVEDLTVDDTSGTKTHFC